MASRAASFVVKVDYYNLTPNNGRHFSHTNFLFHIRTFLEGYNGRLREDHSQDFQISLIYPEFLFGSDLHRNFVASRLLEAGLLDQARLDFILDNAFADTKQILEDNKFGYTISIIFRVKKIVRRYYEVLSMRKGPKRKLDTSTKESIQEKLDGDCMICMEKLVTCTPCSHLFHGDCIEKWLNISNHCPLCRFPMPPNTGSI